MKFIGDKQDALNNPPPNIFDHIDKYPILIVCDLQGQRFEGEEVSLEYDGDKTQLWFLKIRLTSGEEKIFTQHEISAIRHY